jgi:glycosyltransferase involved in cell wall biosynthesis
VPADGDFLLMLGADYAHKNRPFAIRLADELRREHGWEGTLVLAGAHVAHGSSAAAEAELLAERPELGGFVLDIGAVDHAQKRWLLTHAQALLCPSIYEGYGLTPLEAAAAGRPCVYAATTSLGEILGPEAATIVPWDVSASAAAAAALVRPGDALDAHLDRLGAALRRSAWEPVVERLCGAYFDTLAAPYRASAPRAWDDFERERLIPHLAAERDIAQRSYEDLVQRVRHGLRLIDSDGLLSEEQQRGLIRVATDSRLRGPVLAALGRFGRATEDGGDEAGGR